MLIYRILKKFPDQVKELEVTKESQKLYYIKDQIGCPRQIKKTDFQNGDRFHEYGFSHEEAMNKIKKLGEWTEQRLHKRF